MKIGDLFSNAHRVSETLREMPQQKWRPDGCISLQSPAIRNQGNTLGLTHNVSTYFGHFLFHFLEAGQFLLNLNTIWRHITKKFKCSYPIFAISTISLLAKLKLFNIKKCAYFLSVLSQFMDLYLF